MKKKLMLWLFGFIVSILFLILSLSIKNTELIWFQTRIFGLFSFFFLFIAVFLGELRVILIKNSRLKIFKFHVPVAVFSLFLVLLHLISAVADNYKWGKNLTILSYLGFSFSDKWLIYLSFGTLSFYLLLIIGFTSLKRSIRFLKYRNWKRIHYLSYVSFILAYYHSSGLGTDLKTSAFSFYLKPLFAFMFLIFLSLFLTRVLRGLNLFVDQLEINLGLTFFILLLVGSVFLISFALTENDTVASLQNNLTQLKKETTIYKSNLIAINTSNSGLKSKISELKKKNQKIKSLLGGVRNG